jgi:hypothetical protein
MEDISKYIGIPYEFNGDTSDGADCAGLLMMFYRDHKWKPTTYEKPKDHDWFVKTPFKMERFLLKNYKKVKSISDLSFGDIIWTRIGGEGHVLIYLEYGKVLTTFPPTRPQWNSEVLPSKSMVVHRNVWEHGFICGFRRKEA